MGWTQERSERKSMGCLTCGKVGGCREGMRKGKLPRKGPRLDWEGPHDAQSPRSGENARAEGSGHAIAFFSSIILVGNSRETLILCQARFQALSLSEALRYEQFAAEMCSKGDSVQPSSL